MSIQNYKLNLILEKERQSFVALAAELFATVYFCSVKEVFLPSGN
jgi:hypothetical protein